MAKVLVIIPSYNEEENIIKLIIAIQAQSKDFDILVIDDGQDNTADLIREQQKTLSQLFLIKRNSKSGRGSAIIEGLKFGLSNPQYDYFVEMDADFSHQPDELPALLSLAEKNCVVIGSRYLKGSKILNWPLRRRIFSKLANIYANFVLCIGIHDYTNGYRVYGREAIEKLDFNMIKSSGYVVLSEIAYQLFKKGVKFREVKTIFINRCRGASNFSMNEVKEAFCSVIRIKRGIQ